jgi:hypothetical protein
MDHVDQVDHPGAVELLIPQLKLPDIVDDVLVLVSREPCCQLLDATG